MTHSDHVVAMETVSETWLVTAGSDGRSSTLVSGFEAMKDEVVRCMWPDMDGGEEANDMRAEMDDPEFWEGDRWSCGWSFEDGYINVQRVLASRLAKQAPGGWMLVPKEPTEAMMRAGADFHSDLMEADDDPSQSQDEFAVIYRAMLAAAPSPVGGSVS